jgi:hypothetical protein
VVADSWDDADKDMLRATLGYLDIICKTRMPGRPAVSAVAPGWPPGRHLDGSGGLDVHDDGRHGPCSDAARSSE